MPLVTTYSITRDQIISSALRKLGALELGDTPDANTVTNAALILNLMIKHWQTDGIKLWTTTEYTVPLTASKTSYTIGPTGTSSDITADRPMKLIQGWLRNTSVTPNIDTPLQILSKQEYNILGSKFSTGTANSVYLFPLQTTSTVYFFLTPDTATATNYVARLIARRPLGDISASGDMPDFPNEWMNALVWGLADQLALEYSSPLNHRAEIQAKATLYKDQLNDWDVEAESTFFIPDARNRSGYR